MRASRPRAYVLDRDGAAQRVALVHRTGVVARAPPEDRDEARQGTARLGGGDADGVAAVDQPPSAAGTGVVVHLRQVEGQPRQLGSAAHHVAADHLDRGPDRRRGGALRESADVEALEHAEPHLGLRADRGEVVGVIGGRSAGGEGEHRAPVEVEDGCAVLVHGGDAEGGQTGERLPLTRGVLLEADDRGGRGQRVAQRRQPPEDQPAVEEVRPHEVGGLRRLPDGGVPDVRRMGERAAPAEAPAELVVGREREPVTDDRLVQGGASGGQRDRRRGVEDLTAAQLVEPRSARLGRGGAHRTASARASTARARSATASSSIWPSRATAPAPPDTDCSSADTTRSAQSSCSADGL